jgi:hypothetical protein
LHNALHRSSEHHPALELLRHVLGDQSSIDVWLANLFNIDVHWHTHLGRQLLAQTVYILTFLADDDTGARCKNSDARSLCGALDLDAA